MFATWWIFITILTSFYTANLTAFLTLSRFTLPINNWNDLYRSETEFVSVKGGCVEYAIMNVSTRYIWYCLLLDFFYLGQNIFNIFFMFLFSQMNRLQ